MKKIFYILASAIVALGAVACQNEVDENITPGTQNDVVSFSVSFDESTRIAMGEVVDGKANFVFEGNETLYLKYDGDVYEFHNTTDAPNTFTGEGDGLSDIVSEQHVIISNKKNLEDCSNKHNTFNDAAYFRFDGTIGNGSVNLTLSNHVLHCTTGSEPVRLYCNHYMGYPGEEAPEYLDLEANNEYWIDLDNSKINEIAISYDIDGVKVKSTTLNGNTFKIFNLGTLSAAIAEVNGVKYTDFAKAVAAANTNDGTVTLVSDVAIENLVEVSGDVTIEGNATISNGGDVFKVLNGGSLTIGEGVTIESATDCGIFTSAGANDVTVVINGTVRSSSTEYAAVQFNGGTTGVNLTVNGTIENPNDIALMLPAGGEYTIENGATISGATAIYLKGGNLTIAEGATISANGAVKTYEHMGSGAVSTGDALVVESSDYPAAPATATINGGTFTSTEGYAVAHYVQNEEVAKATISIVGGTFNTDPSEFVAENFLALKNYKTENMYDVVAVEKTDWQVVGNHITENEWTPTKGTTMYTIKGTNIVVAKEVEIAANKEFKFVSAKNTSDWSTSYGSNNGTTTNTLNQWNYCGGDNIKVGTAGTYNIFFETSKKHYAVVSTNKMLPTIEYVKYYLNAGGSTYWDKGNAWFVAYFWSGNENSSPIRMTSNNDGTYYVEILKGINKNCLFRRMSSGANNTNNWGTKVDGNNDGYWNTTDNLTINGTNNCYTITGWGGADGKWSTK